MKKYLLALLLYAGSSWAVPVAPIVVPHITFVDGSGAPCAGCKLYTYAAGTTTPLATYTDASGTSTNTNPIVLDAAGGATVWVAAPSYKFILKDALGSTIWSVDQVTGGGGGISPCATPGAIQIANSAADGLTCDATITINTTTHSINVGTLPALHVTIGALGTPTAWTLDTTTPTTARDSIGAGGVDVGTMGQIAVYAADGDTVSGSTAIPNGITGTTQSPSDNSTKIATTAYVAAPGAIAPTSLVVNAGTAMTDNQGTGVKVQHSTGATTSGHGAVFDGDGNVVDAGTAYPGPIAGVQNDVTGSRALGTVYQNTSSSMIIVHGFFTTNGSADKNLSAFTGLTSTPTTQIWGAQYGATTSGFDAGFEFPVPAGYYYQLTATGSDTPFTLGGWFETVLQ